MEQTDYVHSIEEVRKVYDSSAYGDDGNRSGPCHLDLGWLIIKDIIQPPFFLLDVNELLDIFGLFMLVVIGIELLETIMKTYITQGQPHYEVVLSVAIIAISRKVIIWI